MHAQFSKQKIRRLVKTQGVQFNFVRREKNDYGEIDDTSMPQILTLQGVYHEQSSYVSVTSSDATRTQTKKTPMILTVYDDFEASPVMLDDEMEFNGKQFRVTGVVNVNEENFAIDISLEVIQ